MKILHVNHLLDPVSGGGTAERTFQLARFLKEQGASCGILTLDIGDTSSYEHQLKDVAVFKLPCLNRRYYIHITWPFTISKLVSQFDVVHLMGHWTLLNALVALSCIRQGKPYVICPAGALKYYGRSKWLKKTYDFILGRHIVRFAQGWIAITEAEKIDFEAYGIQANAVSVIPNGIDPNQYITTHANPPEFISAELGGSPYVLFLGRLNAIKGPDLLLKAFLNIADQIPSLHLVFVGPDAGLLPELQKTSSHSSIQHRIHFIGYLGGQDKVRVLKSARCLVIPSRNEAMSIVVLEAGICRTPVLFTDHCGLEDFARVNAGLMVKASVNAIEQGLLKMLSSPEELKESANRLYSKVNDEFLWYVQANRYYQLYLRLLRQ